MSSSAAESTSPDANDTNKPPTTIDVTKPEPTAKAPPETEDAVKAICHYTGDLSTRDLQNKLFKKLICEKISPGLSEQEMDDLVKKISVRVSAFMTRRRGDYAEGETAKGMEALFREKAAALPEKIRHKFAPKPATRKRKKRALPDHQDDRKVGLESTSPADGSSAGETKDATRPTLPKLKLSVPRKPLDATVSETDDERPRKVVVISPATGPSSRGENNDSFRQKLNDAQKRKALTAVPTENVSPPWKRQQVQAPEPCNLSASEETVPRTDNAMPSHAIDIPTEVEELRSPSRSSSEATAREHATCPTTKWRALPDERAPFVTRECVIKRLEQLEESIGRVMMAYFQENQIDPEAPSNYVTAETNSDLKHLYATFFGVSDWPAYLEKLEGQGIFLSQEYAFTGLLGAAIYQKVFEVDELPWSLTRDFRTMLGVNTKYFDKWTDDLGQSTNKALRELEANQILDPEFIETKVADHARQLTTFISGKSLIHHVGWMKKLDEPASPLQCDPWQDCLEKAFTKAIILKQTLASSRLTPVSYSWAHCGQSLDTSQVRPKFEIAGAERVLHGLLPGVSTFCDGKEDVVCGPVVVPAAYSVDAPQSEG